MAFDREKPDGSLPILLFHLVVQPAQRGFFCDDQSLMHPYKESTMPTWAASFVNLLLPFICILLSEYMILNYILKQAKNPVSINGKTWKSLYIAKVYSVIIVFFIGAAVSQLLTDIGKYSIGRLRPHYLDVCKPDYSQINCSSGYIENAVCTGTDLALIKEARLSFPSGHASSTMYAMWYLMLYIHSRWPFKSWRVLKFFLQAVTFIFAFYTCMSRISDYKHHWSDVLSGAILGTMVTFMVVFFVSDLFPRQMQNADTCGFLNRRKTENDSTWSTENKDQIAIETIP